MSEPMSWTGLTVVLDGAAGAITCALLHDGQLVAYADAARDTTSGSGPAETIGRVLRGLLVERGGGEAVRRVVVGAGPGSFTGVRSAAALGKGIAHGARISLLSVPSLALAAGVLLAESAAGSRDQITVVLDALRGEWYAQSFTVRNHEVDDASAVARVSTAMLDPAWIGPGRSVDVAPHARGIVRVLRMAGVVDPATWEPAYGREAEATVQRAARLALANG
jgi:tRNA threonylcarbamoyl adenosine modification protein YeaZ